MSADASGSTSSRPTATSTTLPPYWEKVNHDGSTYYVDHTTQSTSWLHPVVLDMQLAAEDLAARMGKTYALRTGLVWEKKINAAGRVFFANLLAKTTSWHCPISGHDEGTVHFAQYVTQGNMPDGWELLPSPLHGYALFVDHTRGEITHVDPRTTA